MEDDLTDKELEVVVAGKMSTISLSVTAGKLLFRCVKASKLTSNKNIKEK